MEHREIRASDAERDRIASVLRDHAAAGRLTLDELDERLGRAYAAATRAELEELVADMPLGEAQPVPGRGRRIFWPGIAPFHERRHLRASCSEAYAQALREMVPRMGIAGFQLVEDVAPRRLTFVDTGGLRVTVMFHPAAGGGTEVSAFGLARRAVRKAFARLSD